MSDALRTVLQRRTVRDGLTGVVNDFLEQRAQINSAAALEHFTAEFLREMRTAFRKECSKRLRQTWRVHILPHLPRPLVVTRGDIMRAAEAILLTEPTDASLAYDRFVECLSSAASLHHSSRPIRVATGYFAYGTERPESIQLATNNAFAVRVAGHIPLYSEYPPEAELGLPARRAAFFIFEGQSTANAHRVFCRQVPHVLRYAIRSADYLRRLDANPPALPADMYFAQHCEAYFTIPGNTDTIGRRLRNALHLGVQSEHQRHHAIGIALSVAVIESLVCVGGDNLATVFSHHTAALLEPDPNYRNEAVSFCRQLYNIRSRVLHGSMLEHDFIFRRHARTLAGAVIRAALERRDFVRRLGGATETPHDFTGELREGQWRQGQLMGVTESPARRLWGAPFEGTLPEPSEDE